MELRGFVSEDEMLKLYGNALAVCYLPWDEDYGYVSLEAMYAGKPLIVARDGGGATEFIEDGREGLLVDPTPQDVARAIDELYFDRKRAGEMGARAREKVLAMKLSWQHVVEKLTQPVSDLLSDESSVYRGRTCPALSMAAQVRPLNDAIIQSIHASFTSNSIDNGSEP